MANVSNFPGQADNYRANFSTTGNYAEQALTFSAGNLNLAGNRPVYVNSISPTDVAGSYALRMRFGGNDYAAGNTIANCGGGSGSVRIYKTGSSTVYFDRDNLGNDPKVRQYNSSGTLTYTWSGQMHGSWSWYTVPTAPASIGIVSQVGTTVNLSYSNSSSAGGSTISSYSAQFSQDGGAWVGTKTVSGNSFNFTGLVPGSTYQFRVYANNAAGSSAATTSASTLIAAYGTLYRAGDFRPITTGRLYRNGAWRNITSAKVYRGGAWRNITNV